MVGINSDTVGWIGTAERSVSTGIHHVEDAVDGFVASRA